MTESNQTPDDLVTRIESRREQLLRVAATIVGRHDAEDVVQHAYLKLRKITETKPINDSYLLKTVRAIAIDLYRRRKSTSTVSFDDKIEIDSSDDEVDDQPSVAGFEAAARDLTAFELSVLRQRELEQKTYKEITSATGSSYAGVRKALQRAKDKLIARQLYSALQEGQLQELNEIRLRERHATLISNLCRLHGRYVDCLIEAFNHRELNKAIKNATLISSALLRNNDGTSSLIEAHLVRMLESGNLYRGQQMYIAETLIDTNYRKHVYRVGKTFLSRVDEMEERPVKRELSRREMAVKNPIDIYDVKTVRPLGRDIRSEPVKNLCRKFQSGEGTADYRRCVGFELQRIHIGDDSVLKSLIDGLRLEHDAMNAIYTTKFLRRIGLKRVPHFKSYALEAITTVAERWPEAFYLSSSVEALETGSVGN